MSRRNFARERFPAQHAGHARETFFSHRASDQEIVILQVACNRQAVEKPERVSEFGGCGLRELSPKLQP